MTFAPGSPRPVLVTGGRGFVGKWIVRRLVELGQPVVTYDRDPWPDEPGVRSIHGELVDVMYLMRVLEEFEVDAVIHTAAISSPDPGAQMPTATLLANVIGTANVLEASRAAGVRRVVNFSSSSIYGWHPEPVDEDTPPAPVATYGVSKVAAEGLTTVFRETHGQDVLALRVCWVYGPGLRAPQEYVGQMIDAALGDRPFSLASGADHPLPLVYVGDVAEAAILAAGAESVGRSVYNVAGPDWKTLSEVAEQVRAAVPGASIELGPGYLPLDELGDHRLGEVDISAAKRDFLYEPSLDSTRGIQNYIEALREQSQQVPG
jgi:UDP-glucose 4-epimerase